MTLLMLLVVASFSAIHLLEFLSYYARVAGSLAGKPVTGYAIQNATTTVTRFFYLALMPMLGFLIDRSLPRAHYLYMGLAALFGAAVLSLLAFGLRRYWIALLTNFITRHEDRPRVTPAELRGELDAGRHHAPASIAPLAAAVFLCYALGVLLSYYFALVFHDYRSTISQLSGIINGAATVLLTFILEPRIARIVDSHAPGRVYAAVQRMLLGRLVAVGIAAPAIFYAICSTFS